MNEKINKLWKSLENKNKPPVNIRNIESIDIKDFNNIFQNEYKSMELVSMYVISNSSVLTISVIPIHPIMTAKTIRFFSSSPNKKQANIEVKVGYVYCITVAIPRGNTDIALKIQKTKQ